MRRKELKEMSDYLPEEVVLQILCRLPVKSLIRFRSVSKSWNSLITTSAFIDSHLTQSLSLPSNSNKLIVSQHDVCYKFIHDDDNDSDSSFHQFQNVVLPLSFSYLRLIGSVNGLFCLCEEEQIILWNPCIRKFITLPKTNSEVINGFGFDARTNDYKVVSIAPKPRPLVEVYSLKDSAWRKTSAGDSLSPGIMFQCCNGAAFINGAVHFQVTDRINTRGLEVCPFILSFDFGDEVFRMISLPESILRSQLQFEIFGFRGSLSLVCYTRMFSNSCSIWVMKEYDVVKTWSKLCTVDLCGVIRRVLGVRKNGHVIVEADLKTDAKLFSYDPQSKQVKNLGIYGQSFNSCADNYVESLVLLNKPVLFDKANDALSLWVESSKGNFWSPPPKLDQISAVGLQGVVKKALPLAGGIGRVESKDERVRDKETICKLKKAMVDQQEERVSDKETICKLKKAMVHQQEEIATLKIEMTSLKSQMATLKSLFLSVQQWNNQVENTSSGVGDIGSYLG
ncbi:F-box/kelch-repeat protein At3g23880-like isoform X2 [Quercus robur]|uniref:F-box/kelch-repeat protein At3g23880-like isoform X2 n=1 Tax=Quercus robur TaxID=38942 RepID=UPI002162DF9A|nr:F-box/kelch-repeat protein At3g23880-like isoform X2 [Quercus robur]